MAPTIFPWRKRYSCSEVSTPFDGFPDSLPTPVSRTVSVPRMSCTEQPVVTLNPARCRRRADTVEHEVVVPVQATVAFDRARGEKRYGLGQSAGAEVSTISARPHGSCPVLSCAVAMPLQPRAPAGAMRLDVVIVVPPLEWMARENPRARCCSRRGI